MLGGRAHPGFRSWGLPRCIDQGVDLRSSARPDLKVAVSLSAPRRILSDRRRRQNRTIVSLITARSRSPAMPETSLVVVDPGHFHATLVQHQMYPELSPVVRVYAPLGPDLIDYLSRIARYNGRLQAATHWRLDVHAGPDFLDRIRDEPPGGVAIFSGRNRGQDRSDHRRARSRPACARRQTGDHRTRGSAAAGGCSHDGE